MKRQLDLDDSPTLGNVADEQISLPLLDFGGHCLCPLPTANSNINGVNSNANHANKNRNADNSNSSNSNISLLSTTRQHAFTAAPPRKRLAFYDSTADITPEAMLASEMNKLTLLERETISNNIHGIEQDMVETPEFIEQCFVQLEKELKKVKKEDRQAYQKALFLNKIYVKDHKFEVMFLRASNYDPLLTARRLTFHFEKKLELFGSEKLTKHITYNDLGEDDKNSMKGCSSFCFPGVKDRSGRLQYFYFYSAQLKNPMSPCHARHAWYINMSCSVRDEETQRKGTVVMFITQGATVKDYLQHLKVHEKNVFLMDALPQRYVAYHMCVESEVLRSFLPMGFKLAKSKINASTRLHYGSLLECQYELNTFGIHSAKIFASGGTKADYNLMIREIEKLRKDDELRFPETDNQQDDDDVDGKKIILLVRDADVLVGKGIPYQAHPGTMAMMEIVKELKPRHDAAYRPDKPAVAAEVLERVKAAGGRFLNKKGDNWVEVNAAAAHAKVAMGFRNLSRKEKRQRDLEKS